MVVNSSSIGMESARRYTSVRMDAYYSGAFRSAGSVGGKGLGVKDDGKAEKEKTSGNASSGFRDSMSSLRERFEQMKVRHPLDTKREQDAMEKIRMDCINYLFRILFGETNKKNPVTDDTVNPPDSTSSTQMVLRTYGEEHYYSESEETAFSAEGKVVTADGRELTFHVDLKMSRRFEEYYSEKYEVLQPMCDPLVINLDTEIAGVSDQKFLFDLDADGMLDQISSLDAGSGYLALDLNGDGVINDGSELFGTKSGDGFKDLAKYDSDGNGWIDEADDIWSRLLIFTQGSKGETMLYGLAEKNVGAIYLGNIGTDFSLNSASTNQVNAAIRKTGIFLYENGNVGTVQHLDLAK